MRKPSRWAAAALVLSIAALVACALPGWIGARRAERKAHAASAPAKASRAAGRAVAREVVRLRSAHGHPIWVVVNDRAYQALRRGKFTRHAVRMRAVYRAGCAFGVPEGTKAQILVKGNQFHRVRILDGKRRGRTGWVPAYNVLPLVAGVEN